MFQFHKFFHWFYHKQKKHLLFNFGTCLFIWIFLSIALPFGINNNNISNYFILSLILLAMSSIWIVVSYSTDLFARLSFSNKPFENHRLDLLFFILKIFIFINVQYLIRNILCQWSCFNLLEYLELWAACILLIGLVYLPYTFYGKYMFFRNMVGKSETDNVKLFEFSGEGKSSLKLDLGTIMYFKSDDNYVDIVTLEDDNTQKTHVLRVTLSSIEKQLHDQSQFIRIHRSFIMNFQFLKEYSRSDSVFLSTEEKEFELPVSKKYREELLKLIG